MEEDNYEVKYAGFFTRLLVFLVDIFVVSFLVYIINIVVNIEKSPVVILLIWWLYTAIMLSRWKTTIGGKILGTRILDIDFSKLSILKASIRFFVSIVPFILYTYLRGLQHTMTLPPSPTVQMLPQLIFILLPFIMYFSKKRQMIHDMLVKSIVIDVNSKTKKTDTIGERIVPIGQKVLRVLGSVLFLIVFGYVAIYTFVFYTLGKQSTNNHNSSFQIEYHPKDYNNSKIIFYKKEIEEASKIFIEAEEMYDIFKSDVKKDLALGCIRYFIKREGSDNWLDEGSTHRVSARNKYANSEDKIKKEKRNSNYMSKHFYTFDLNIVNHVVDDVTKVWSDKNESVCENKLSTNELYEIFIRQYITRFDSENIHSPFGSKPQQREIDWFNILKEKRSDIFNKIEEEKERIKKEENRVEEERIAQIREKRDQRKAEKYKAEQHNITVLLTLKDLLFQENKNVKNIDNLLKQVKNIDKWIDGSHNESLLYQAIKHNDINASKILLEKGASTVKSSTIMHLALSDSTDIELFELILEDYLKPKNHRNINMLLIEAIEQHASEEKVKVIFKHMTKVDKEYFYVVESAIKYCSDVQLVRLFLSKDVSLTQNERLFSLLHKTLYKCSNKKEIELLFDLKKETKELEDKLLKSKFIRFDK